MDSLAVLENGYTFQGFYELVHIQQLRPLVMSNDRPPACSWTIRVMGNKHACKLVSGTKCEFLTTYWGV